MSSAHSALDDRVRHVETKPLAETPLFVSKERNPLEYGTLLGALLPKYQDPKSRENAEKYADTIVISPTNVRGRYRVLVVRDVNRDKKLTPDIDRTYADVVGGKVMAVGFELTETELAQMLKDALPNVRQLAPK